LIGEPTWELTFLWDAAVLKIGADQIPVRLEDLLEVVDIPGRVWAWSAGQAYPDSSEVFAAVTRADWGALVALCKLGVTLMLDCLPQTVVQFLKPTSSDDELRGPERAPLCVAAGPTRSYFFQVPMSVASATSSSSFSLLVLPRSVTKTITTIAAATTSTAIVAGQLANLVNNGKII
jgi:hypothetical protein